MVTPREDLNYAMWLCSSLGGQWCSALTEDVEGGQEEYISQVLPIVKTTENQILGEARGTEIIVLC
jgi:hypothetical protein